MGEDTDIAAGEAPRAIGEKEVARAICAGTLPPEDAHRADALVEHMGDIRLPYWMNFERAARAAISAHLAALEAAGYKLIPPPAQNLEKA